MASAVDRLDDEEREQVDVVFVTTDPAVDDTEKVGRYVGRFDPDFIGLTGELDTIIANAEPLGHRRRAGREAAHAAATTVAHGTQMIAHLRR